MLRFKGCVVKKGTAYGDGLVSSYEVAHDNGMTTVREQLECATFANTHQASVCVAVECNADDDVLDKLAHHLERLAAGIRERHSKQSGATLKVYCVNP